MLLLVRNTRQLLISVVGVVASINVPNGFNNLYSNTYECATTMRRKFALWLDQL